MKKLLAIFMVLAMLLSFAACSGKENPETTQPTETTTEAPKFDETVVTDGKTTSSQSELPLVSLLSTKLTQRATSLHRQISSNAVLLKMQK